MKSLPTLYSRTSTGATQQWSIEVSGNRYRVVSGQVNGQLVTNEWTTCQGKNIGRANETTAEEQACAEAEAKWEKKIKTGYTPDVNKIDSCTAYVEPMLAKKLSDREDKVTFPAMLDRKYNGGRIVTTSAGCFSRKGEQWKTIPHIFDALAPLFKKYPNLVIDGEGYNHEYRFKLNELMSVLRKTKNITPEDLKKSEQIVEYHCYDAYGFENITEETGCGDRRNAMKKLLTGIKYVKVVDYVIVNNLRELYTQYQSFVDDGYEGAMYRTLNAPYSHSRSSDLLKVKPEDSSEAVVKKIMEGTGNWSGAAKTATLDWNGVEFDATFKGQYGELQKILKNPSEFLNNRVTFLYNGLTGLNKPNFARIDIANCFKN